MNNLVSASLYIYYHLLALEHYQDYVKANKDFNEISSNNQSFDFLSHSKDEIHKYISSWNEKQKNGIICIILEAMAMEAYINYFIVEKYGFTIFNNKYKDKSIWYKYKTVIKNETGKNFSEYKEAYKQFSILVNIRNSMVHSKTEVIDIYNDDQQEFIDKMSGLFGGVQNNIFNSIDDLIKTFDLMSNILT